ncbi:MAG: bifunctional UDP-N-acetylglucosamine diphosphorylase/glucosamine-1-phosphate N-acetyltransferase GlmU [Salaquimonas sp.]
MARTCLTIILAAGEGTRMKSSDPKVLHKVAGLSLLGHVIKSAQAAGGDAQAIVVGREAERVETEAKNHSANVSIYLQSERLGTAHAVLAASEAIEKGFDDVLVLMGDAPLIEPSSLLRLRRAVELGADVAILGFRTNEPDGYGRLIEKNGELFAIREHKDASEDELKIRFCNGGILAFSGKLGLSMLQEIGNDNVKGEYYLTDIVEIARSHGHKVVAIEAEESELHGINDRYELARIEGHWQRKRRERLLRQGVTMHAPDTVYLSHDTVIGIDAIVEPNVVFGPGVIVENAAHIRAFSHLEGASVATGAIVGPYARLRPGTQLMQGSKVGNFCETKNAVVEPGAKINHLSYIGDARVGAKANIGAGTITCNYDGMNKHFTDIGANVFVGSSTSLIAPVKLGEGAYVGSGSVITEDVPANAMAVARGRQVNKEGRANLIRERNQKIKDAKSKA